MDLRRRRLAAAQIQADAANVRLVAVAVRRDCLGRLRRRHVLGDAGRGERTNHQRGQQAGDQNDERAQFHFGEEHTLQYPLGQIEDRIGN